MVVGNQQQGMMGSEAPGQIRGPDKLGFLGLGRALKQVLWEDEGFLCRRKLIDHDSFS